MGTVCFLSIFKMASRRSPLALLLLGTAAALVCCFCGCSSPSAFVAPSNMPVALTSSAMTVASVEFESPLDGMNSNIVVAEQSFLDLALTLVFFGVLLFAGISLLDAASIQNKKVLERQEQFWEEYTEKWK